MLFPSVGVYIHLQRVCVLIAAYVWMDGQEREDIVKKVEAAQAELHQAQDEASNTQTQVLELQQHLDEEKRGRHVDTETLQSQVREKILPHLALYFTLAGFALLWIVRSLLMAGSGLTPCVCECALCVRWRR